MNRRPLLVVAALTSAVALSLSACSSDSKDKGSDKIAGAGGGKAKQSASPSVKPSDSAQRPAVTLPGDVKDKFESWQTGDTAKDAVLADASRRIDATNFAITEGNADEPALGFYYKGDALVGAAQWVKGFQDEGTSITGTIRYYKPVLKIYAKDKATLTYCSFEGYAFAKDRKTNRVKKTPIDKDSYIFYSTRMEKNSKGVWQTAVLNSETGYSGCMGQ